MKKLLLVPMILIMFMGCASMADREQFYQAQQVFFKNIINQEQPPIFKMEALPGKTIENLASIEVYVPQPPIDPKSFKQFSEAHPGWESVNLLIRGLTFVGGAYVIADKVADIFESATKNAGGTTMNITGKGNTGSIAPTTNNISGAGSWGAGTSTPTVVTSPPADVYFIPVTP